MGLACPAPKHQANHSDPVRPAKQARKVKFNGARRVPPPQAPAAKEILRIPQSRRAISQKWAWHVLPPSTRQTTEILRVPQSGCAKSNLKGLEGSRPHKRQQARKSCTSRKAGAQRHRKGPGTSCPQAPDNQANHGGPARPAKRGRKVKFKGAQRVPPQQAPAGKEVLRVPRSGRATSQKGAWHILTPSTRQPGKPRRSCVSHVMR
ncbi:hypothetical protein NDU88_006317 [Pleurodeles waltl]|uniref:Uncharacterized protein n=1 Tax=Pleurodeles waltl TaxID=8319 RepID=A0AAV7RRN7_PLEWA|nr:hypothetical protein NDU88_006317 [Pleurodeles waltl]